MVGNLVAVRVEVTVKAVIREIQFAVGEPLVERWVRIVEHDGWLLEPCDAFESLPVPEIEPVFLCFVVDAGPSVGRCREIWRRLEQAIFLEEALYCLSFFADAASRPRRMLRE